MAEFKRESHLQKYQLQRLNEVVAEYLRMIELPYGSRHRKTIMTFTGDRFKPVDIKCKYVVPQDKDITPLL